MQEVFEKILSEIKDESIKKMCDKEILKGGGKNEI